MMSLNGEVMKSRSSLGENDMELENHQSNVDRRLSFSLNEEQRKVKSFQERTSDVDQAINWILNELKLLKQQDHNLMRKFVKLRSVLNSVKTRATFDRKISLPDTSPGSPLSPLYSITEESPTTLFRYEGSPGQRRRAETEPASPVCFDSDSDFDAEKYEHFAI